MSQDGKRVIAGHSKGLALFDLRLSILWLRLFHHEEHSVEGVLYDDVAVSTGPIGCR